MDQNSSNLSFFIGNSRTFLFKTQEIIENSTFRKNKFPDLPEKVLNDKPDLISLLLVWCLSNYFLTYESNVILLVSFLHLLRGGNVHESFFAGSKVRLTRL